MESQKLKKSALCVQFLATLIISNLICLTGFTFAWPSYTYAILKSNETVLESPMTSGELSTVGSLPNIGALLATPFCGYALDKFGRKYAAMLFGLPYVIAWGIITVTKSVYLVITAVGIAGLGAGGQVVTSVYIAEICHDSIRGGLISSTVYVFFIGLLISYTLGGYLSYHNVVYVHLAQSILYIVLLALLKESPVFLMKRGKEKEAAEAIAFYHRIAMNSKQMEIEIRKLKLQLDPKIIKMLDSGGEEASAEELLDNSPSTTEKEEEHVSVWKFLKRSESSRRALTIVLILMSLSILMGAVVLQVYAEPLFKEAVPTMDSNTCSIILALVYLVACMIGAILVDKLGRKSLMTVTCVICGVLTIMLGSQLHLHYAPHWFTAFGIYGFSFVFNVGAAVVPYVVTAEVFLPEVKASAEELLDNSPSTTEKEEEHVSVWKFLKRSESSRRALTIVLILMSLSILMGAVVLQVYAEPLFKEAVPTMDSNTCSIILALVYLVACMIGAILVDKLGRKSLMTVTCVICGVLTIMLGSQLHLHYAPHWFTAFGIYGFSFVFNVGAAVVPYVVTAEVFLPEVRGLGNSCVMSFAWMSNFVTLIIFTPLVEAVGLGMSFYFFSVMCFLTAAFSHFYLPETKGLSVDAIQKLFLKEKRQN